MRHLLLLISSVGLLACGSADPDGTMVMPDAESDVAEDVADAADALHGAMDDAANVENTLMDKKDAMDAAVDDATD